MFTENLLLTIPKLHVLRVGLTKKRLLLPCFILVLCFQETTREIAVQVLADAFLQVSVFVLISLSVYYIFDRYLKLDFFTQINQRSWLSLIAAAFLGVLPGCGGAIIVVTQYTKGKLSFGALVAVLTSTMGDAAFLLISQQPANGALIMGISLIAGIISGGLVNRLHSALNISETSLMASPKKQAPPKLNKVKRESITQHINILINISTWFWSLVAFPSLLFAILLSLQVDIESILKIPEESIRYFGAAAGFATILLWSLSSKGDDYESVTSEDCVEERKDWKIKAIFSTHFVTSWVVVSFLAFELGIFWFGVDFGQLFKSLDKFTVLLAVFLGFLPGCGPQILLTSLYLHNIVPFSAQIGNAISNDGDALFPALALAPKAAIIATIYTAIPAIIMGYGYYILFE